MRRTTSLFLLSICLFALCLVATATTIVPVSVEKLTADSSEVVRVRVVSSQASWNAQHTLIYTYSRVQVIERMKGGKMTELTVKQPGGTVGSMTERVFGVRHLRDGEEAVLFLHPSDDGATLSVTGLMQGNFTVRYFENGEPVVSNGVPEAKSFNVQTQTVSDYRGTNLKISELRQRVTRATAGGVR